MYIMSVSEWGNATWYMMHTVAAKLKPNNNDFIPILFNQLHGVVIYHVQIVVNMRHICLLQQINQQW